MLLSKGDAAPLLDRLDAERAVGIAAGHHDPDGVFALILGQRAEEDVNRLALTVKWIDRVKMETSIR